MENGPFRRDQETTMKIRDFFCRESNLEEIVKVALRRFPEIETEAGIPVEKISVKELKNRLREINHAGYNVAPFYKMKRVELVEYLIDVRKKIKAKAEKFCPDVLAEVDRANSQQIQGVVYFR